MTRDAIWCSVYGAMVAQLVAEHHRLTTEWPAEADYGDISENATCVADSDAEARAHAALWVPCADCLETGAGDGDACEECGGWGMRTPTRAEAQLAEEAGVLPDHERPLPWSNS